MPKKFGVAWCKHWAYSWGHGHCGFFCGISCKINWLDLAFCHHAQFCALRSKDKTLVQGSLRCCVHDCGAESTWWLGTQHSDAQHMGESKCLDAISGRPFLWAGPIWFHTLEHIHNAEVESVPENDWHLPIWQSAPCAHAIKNNNPLLFSSSDTFRFCGCVPAWAPHNWDGLSWLNVNFACALRECEQVVTGETCHLPNPASEEQVKKTKWSAAWCRGLVGPLHDPSEPVTDISHPILNSTNALRIQNPEHEDIVGMFAVSIHWRMWLEDVLSETSWGVVVTLKNPCDPNFTCQIDGPKAIYLGRGDHHQPKCKHMKVEANLLDHTHQNSGSKHCFGAPIDQEFCPWSFKVFPSKHGEDGFTSSNPVVFAFIVAAIFVFTSLVFVCCDGLVELQQWWVLSWAFDSTALVASLFPKSVRDRL